MTNFQVGVRQNCPPPPHGLVGKDKALKEQNGQAAYIIPAQTIGTKPEAVRCKSVFTKSINYKTQGIDSVESPLKKDSSKELKVGAAIVLIILAAYGVFKGRKLFTENSTEKIRQNFKRGVNEGTKTHLTSDIKVDTPPISTTKPPVIPNSGLQNAEIPVVKTEVKTSAAKSKPQVIKTSEPLTSHADDAAQKAKEAQKAREAAQKSKEAEEVAQKTAKEAEEQAAKKALEMKELDLNNYNRVQRNMKEAAIVSKKADTIMLQPDFETNIKELMSTKVLLHKGKYDCTMVETTLDDVFRGSIKGTYEKPVENLYHGTNSGSYKNIMENGFSVDACNIAESGKGVYFGLEKEAAGLYSTGGVVTAKYTGGKIADVKAGVVDSLGYSLNVKKLFEKKFGINALDINNDGIVEEILNRMYTKKLNSLGYNALHSASIGAKCEYITILDPKYIKIVK